MKEWIIQIGGWTLVFLAVADLYVTVLYARSDLSLLSQRLGRMTQAAFRTAALAMPKIQHRLVTFVGPTLLALTFLTWMFLLWIGFALVSWPALGNSIQKTSGTTPTDLATALYYSGYTLATLGFGDVVPQTGFFRVLAVVEALIGFSVLTLSLTYFLSVYSALTRRNVMSLSLHHASGGSGDSLELLARLGPGGDFTGASAMLHDFNCQLHDLYESHHAYPVLHYFHFRPRFYALSHMLMMMADVAALARSNVDPERHRAFVQSVGVEGAESASHFVLTRLSELFLPKGYQPSGDGEASPEEQSDWRKRQGEAAQRLAAAGIATVQDSDRAGQRYVELRGRWHRYGKAFDHYMLGGQD